MQKPTIILLLIAVIALIAGVFYLPQLVSTPAAPVMTWSESDEVEGSEDEPEVQPDVNPKVDV